MSHSGTPIILSLRSIPVLKLTCGHILQIFSLILLFVINFVYYGTAGGNRGVGLALEVMLKKNKKSEKSNYMLRGREVWERESGVKRNVNHIKATREESKQPNQRKLYL